MASAGTVTVDFAAETAKFTAELKKVNDQLKGMNSSFLTLDKAAKTALTFVSVGALVGFAKNAFNAANELDRLSQKTGIAVESLSRLQFVAGQADTEFSSLTTAVTQFQKRLGSGEAATALNKIGVSVENIKALSPEDQLIEIARGFQTIEDPAKRVTRSMELFGKAGADILPFLLQGPEGIKKLQQEADRLGVTLDGVTVAALDRAEKEMLRLVAAAKGVTTQLLAIASIAILGPEQATQAQELVKLMERESELRSQIAKLQNPNLFLSIVANEESRNKQLEQANKALAINLQLIDAIGKKELERLNTQRQAKEVGGLDIGEVSVTAQRIRVPGAPENFDELQQEFVEKEAEQFRELQLKAIQDFTNESARIQIQGAEDLSKQLTKIDEERANAANFWLDHQLETHKTYLETKAAQEQATFDAGVGLLRAFAGQSKKAAIALIAVNKALAIARAIQNTAVAVTAAAASAPPPYNAPAIAFAKALGVAQIGLIAATGFVEAGNVGAGGASVGSSANPVFTSNADTSFQNDTRATAQSQRVTQIIIPGNIYSIDDFKQVMVDTLKEVSDSDVIIFDQNSAQAQVIRQA